MESARAEVLGALVLFVSQPLEMLKVVMQADDRADAASELRARFGLTELGAQAVLDCQVTRLTRVDVERLVQELDEVGHG